MEANKKSRSAPTHPAFKEMIIAAIKENNEKKGSSRQAIRKYIECNFTIPQAGFSTYLNKELKKLIDSEVLVHPKKAPGSYIFNLLKKEREEKAKAKAALKKEHEKKKLAEKKVKELEKKKKAKITTKKAATKSSNTKKTTITKKTKSTKEPKNAPKRKTKDGQKKKTPKKVALKKVAAKKTPKKTVNEKTTKKTTSAKKARKA